MTTCKGVRLTEGYSRARIGFGGRSRTLRFWPKMQMLCQRFTRYSLLSSPTKRSLLVCLISSIPALACRAFNPLNVSKAFAFITATVF